MATITIDLPDQQAAALQTKAAVRGMTLEEWFRQIADAEAGVKELGDQQRWKEAVERIRALRKRVKPDPEGWTIRDHINYGRP